MDLALVENTGGDQVVEVAGRLPQLVVALADRGGGDPVQLGDQGCPRVAVTRAVADGRKLDPVSWPSGWSAFQPLQQHRGDGAGWSVKLPIGGPLVGVAGGMTAGRGDHIATTAPPVHPLQALGVDVAETGGSQVGVDPVSWTPERLRASGPELCRPCLAASSWMAWAPAGPSTSKTSKVWPVVRPMLAWGCWVHQASTRARLQVASLTPCGTRLPRGCLPTWLQPGSRHEQPVPTAG